MKTRKHLALEASKALLILSALLAFAAAFVPPSDTAVYGAGEALFARFIFWSGLIPLSLLATVRARRKFGASGTIPSARTRYAEAIALVGATLILWDVVATVLYFLGWAIVPTSLFVLALALASAVLLLLAFRES